MARRWVGLGFVPIRFRSFPEFLSTEFIKINVKKKERGGRKK